VNDKQKRHRKKIAAIKVVPGEKGKKNVKVGKALVRVSPETKLINEIEEIGKNSSRSYGACMGGSRDGGGARRSKKLQEVLPKRSGSFPKNKQSWASFVVFYAFAEKEGSRTGGKREMRTFGEEKKS